MEEQLNWIKARLAEPSTHAGISALITIASTFIPQPYQTGVLALASIFGFTAIAKTG